MNSDCAESDDDPLALAFLSCIHVDTQLQKKLEKEIIGKVTNEQIRCVFDDIK